MSKLSCTVLFAGAGGVEAGLVSAGIDCPQRVEFDTDICAVNEANFGFGVLCAPVESVDLSRLQPTDYLWASPPCQSHSVARSKKLSARDDEGVGIHILDYVRVLRPRAVCVENVPPYSGSPVFAAIVQGLHAAGYRSEWSIVNAADYGVPQTRRRLILRAAREGEALLPLTPTHAKNPAPAGLFGPALLPWNGWYGAIEDILDTLPESQLAEWQLLRLKNTPFANFLYVTGNTQKVNPTGTGVLPCLRPANTVCTNSERGATAFLVSAQSVNNGAGVGVSDADNPAMTTTTNSVGRVKVFLCGVQGQSGELARDGVLPSPTIATAHDAAKYRAFLVDGQNAGQGRLLTVRHSQEPSHTQVSSAKGTSRAWFDANRTVSMTPRALARFQSFPDSFILPSGRTLVSKVVGNAVPPPLAKAVALTLPGMEACQ